MPPIRPLPALLVNQIAAGEVIERPASVVKELLENSIDARATRIDVEIEDGGRELIRVSDDGCGIPQEELHLAVAPHATSKIACADDLDRIATMGFRGEALASIASVSRLAILSRTRMQSAAATVEAEGEVAFPVRPAGAPPGTTVTVRNLFFNTPARRKFLKTAPTEASRIAETVESIALAHPHVAFSLRSNGRLSLELVAEDSPRRRALAVLGTEMEAQLLEVSMDTGEDRGITLWGLVGRPEIARSNASHQRLYLNGRPIRDRSLQHALKEAYRGLIEPGRYPTLVLFIEMAAAQVDVNVHPAKAEVRFRNAAAVHGAVLSAVRNRLREADLTPRFSLGESLGNGDGWPMAGPALVPEFGAGSRPALAAPLRSASEFVDYFRRLDPAQKGFVYSEVKQALGGASTATEKESMAAGRPLDVRERDFADLPEARPTNDVMQVHASYLVTQDAQGLLIIDQHALHERVMFERLLERIGASDLESQRLLIPTIVEVGPAEIEALGDLQRLFARIGLEAEPVGPTAIAVHAFPSFLLERGVEIQPFLCELLERAVNDGFGHDVEKALHEVLDMMACKAAVKAGDRLAPEELRELLLSRERIERSSNCPHGRPTTLRLTIAQLDRQFGRT